MGLILVYKMLKNLIPGLRREDSFEKDTTTSLILHHLLLKNLLSCLDHRRAAFSQTVFNTRNKLQLDSLSAPIVGVFKRTLDAGLCLKKMGWNLTFPSSLCNHNSGIHNSPHPCLHGRKCASGSCNRMEGTLWILAYFSKDRSKESQAKID